MIFKTDNFVNLFRVLNILGVLDPQKHQNAWESEIDFHAAAYASLRKLNGFMENYKLR